jgi:hypothetical protein
MIERYVEFVGEHEINAIFKYAERLRDLSILHVNSTAAGGGVAEILHRLVPLMRELGLNVEWKVIRGDQGVLHGDQILPQRHTDGQGRDTR